MNKRAAGVVFCFIAAFLFAAKYLAAAIFASSVASWNSDLFGNMLQYVGSGLTVTSIISLVIGLIYLVWGEINKNQ